METDCKSVGVCLRRFESCTCHQPPSWAAPTATAFILMLLLCLVGCGGSGEDPDPASGLPAMPFPSFTTSPTDDPSSSPGDTPTSSRCPTSPVSPRWRTSRTAARTTTWQARPPGAGAGRGRAGHRDRRADAREHLPNEPLRPGERQHPHVHVVHQRGRHRPCDRSLRQVGEPAATRCTWPRARRQPDLERLLPARRSWALPGHRQEGVPAVRERQARPGSAHGLPGGGSRNRQ